MTDRKDKAAAPQGGGLRVGAVLALLVSAGMAWQWRRVAPTAPAVPPPRYAADGNTRVYSREELKRYVGTKAGGDPRIFLAILGEVFDVSAGAGFYGAGEGYAGFAGRDASAAFLSGDFTPAGLHDDLAGLTPVQLVEMFNWRDSTYIAKYIPMGVVEGCFYGADGAPTVELLHVRKMVKVGVAEKERLAVQRKLYNGCNSKWTQEHGKTLWCHEPLIVRHQRLVDGEGKETLRCVCAVATAEGGGVQPHPECDDTSECKLPKGDQ